MLRRSLFMLKRLISIVLVIVLVAACASTALAATLRKGSRGSEVTRLQQALQALGFYAMKVDGVYGKGTVTAVKAFQQSTGLKADGIAGPQTQGKLYADSSSVPQETAPAAAASIPNAQASPDKLKIGDSGEAVVQLQTKLWYLGYYTAARSGIFDAATRTAVQSFQQAKRLSRDGVAGKKTLAALDSAWSAAKTAAGSTPDEAAALLNRIVVESGAVNGTLVLSKNGKTFLTWSFGGADENTCYRIASITKWVTAIGLMTLYDQGKLDLDRDIGEYLPFKVRNPAFPNVAVTARMLLSHTSSLSAKANNYHPNWEIISKSYDPLFDESIKPGTKYAYADYNGALFGCLIEAITGESVQNYLNRTVFQPLGLTAAYSPAFLPSGTAAKDMLYTNGRVGISVASDRRHSYNNMADPKGNNGYTVGRLYINTASLTKLARMMLNGGELDGVRILNSETVSLMEADQPGLAKSPYGLSNVRHSQFPRGTWYGHQGRYIGLTSNVYYQKETGITLALVMNGYDYKLEDNIVLPAVTLMKNMEMLDTLCNGTVQ